MMRFARRGFTLIELLTVIAISAVLMTIIVVPVFQSFNLTRSAQAFANAQDLGRILTDKIAREIGNAASVRNTNALVATTLNGNNVSVPGNALIVQVPKVGSQTTNNPGYIEVVLPYVKLDIVVPAEGDAKSGPPYTNPVNNFVDPTMQSPKGQPVLPVGPGATIIRYFVGLRNPFAAYNNPYDGILMSLGGSRDNLFVLYRAEVQPYVYRAGIGSNGDPSLAYRPNLAFFQSDPVTDKIITNVDDPRFFLSDGAYANKAAIIQNWLNQAVLETEISRYDMIQPVYDKASHIVTYDGDAPLLVPLIQFRPMHISNDPAQGQVAIRAGEETNNAAAIGPDVFKTQYGLWGNQIARVWPQGWNPATGSGAQQYFVGRNDPTNGQPGAPPGYSIYYYDPNVSPTDYNSGQEVFDVYTYDLVTSSQGLYPFSQAVTASNLRSNWLSNPVIVSRFTPFDLNSAKGKIFSSFGINEVGNPNIQPTSADPQNLPMVATSPVGGPYTPLNDPTPNGAFFSPPFQYVNELFNWTWNNAPNLQPQIDRFIDLRVTPNADGSVSPLHPTLGFPKSRIVPGSEVVYGPDQLPGLNLGNTVRYVRTTHAPGPNQYQINYVDQAEPNNGAAIDYTMIGLTPAQVNGFNPLVYNPQNFCSAVIQPRYKKGYIRFNSDPNVPLPFGQIQIAYRFQFNGNQTGQVAAGTNVSDTFAVDYDTRQLISVLLTIRNYPQTTNIPNPQMVTLKATGTVRNVIR